MKRNRTNPSKPVTGYQLTPGRGPSRARRIGVTRAAVTSAMAALGIILWLALASVYPSHHVLGLRRWLVVAAAVGVALVPPVNRAIIAALDWARYPSRRARTVTAMTIGFLAGAYFIFTAVNQGRDLFPKTHDDQSYYLQMQMLAEGRLWMPQHELADFFDTFYVLSRPRYASLYFPGAALLYVPTIWLGLPTWLMPVVVAGAIVGLVYRITAEVLDGVAGVLAAAVLASLSWFRVYSILLTSHEPMLLLGLLQVWVWLRWRRTRRPGWFVALGIFAGWGAITRPIDALCFTIPVGLAIARDLVKSRQVQAIVAARTLVARSPVRASAQAAVLILCSAAPFVALQGVFNRGVTGHWLQTPYTLYIAQDQPNTEFGFRPYDPSARPQSQLAQKQDYYQSFFVPFIQRHQPGTFLRVWARTYAPMIADVTLPAFPLVALLPLGLVGLTKRGLNTTGLATGRGTLWAILPLFVGLYMLNTAFLEHYAILIVPSIIVLLISAGRALEAALSPLRKFIAAGFATGLIALAIVTLPELNDLWGTKDHPEYVAGDETFFAPVMRAVHAMVTENPGDPAVILFPYSPSSQNRGGDPTYEEPVYNNQSAWPDDARVIVAHDLGPEKNRQIFAYFARRQPERHFYRFNRAAALAPPNQRGAFLEDLGDARTLAAGAGSD